MKQGSEDWLPGAKKWTQEINRVVKRAVNLESEDPASSPVNTCMTSVKSINPFGSQFPHFQNVGFGPDHPQGLLPFQIWKSMIFSSPFFAYTCTYSHMCIHIYNMCVYAHPYMHTYAHIQVLPSLKIVYKYFDMLNFCLSRLSSP